MKTFSAQQAGAIAVWSPTATSPAEIHHPRAATIGFMDPAERDRYSRQILFPGIGEAGQEKLLRAHAVVVGCGALGSFHTAALARAGVARITVIDRDYVEPSNLHRQWLFDEEDAAQSM